MKVPIAQISGFAIHYNNLFKCRIYVSYEGRNQVKGRSNEVREKDASYLNTFERQYFLPTVTKRGYNNVLYR